MNIIFTKNTAIIEHALALLATMIIDIWQDTSVYNMKF